MKLEQAVWVDPGRMSGAPCFRGSRLPIQQLFDWLADGVSLDEFVNDFRIDRAAAEVVLRTAGAELCRRRLALARAPTGQQWSGGGRDSDAQFRHIDRPN